VEKAAKDQGFADDAPALMLIKNQGAAAQERTRALREALSATSHPPLPDLVVESSDTTKISDAVRAVVREHEDLAIVLANGDDGLSGAAGVRDQQHGKRRLISIGGFITIRDIFRGSMGTAYAALGDVDTRALADRTYEEALQLARGEKVPDLLEVEVQVLHPLGSGPRITPEPKIPEELLNPEAQGG
jgi:ABC-type sugar transport system substrate-binding protein